MSNHISNEDWISRLYQEMYGCMFTYATSILNDRTLAEEAVQDAFCILCIKVDEVIEKENPNGWLMRVLQNVMRNMNRQRTTMNRLIMTSLQEVGQTDYSSQSPQLKEQNGWRLCSPPQD